MLNHMSCHRQIRRGEKSASGGKHLFNLILVILLVVLITSISSAQIPRVLSYQGILTDSTGNPKPDGSYMITFKLYESSGGGSEIWSEQKTLQVKRGLFSTTLGDQDPFGDDVKFDRAYWLGLQVESEPELSPRIPLTAVGYSLNSLHSDTAKFAHSTPQQNLVDSARIAGTIPDNTITADKILDGTIQRIDVASDFTAPKADTATVAITALSSAPTGAAGGDLTGTYPNPSIADNVVTSVMILDGVIRRDDVAPDFIAPYSDTAAYARVAPQAGFVDSARIAGMVSDNSITNSKIADGSVTGTKIQSGQVVKSLNSKYDNITLSAAGGATITSSGDTIIINAGSGGGGTGIQGVQNTNNTLEIIDPNGPTATINVKNGGITTTQIADGTIQRIDVVSNFTAPKADTAIVALTALSSASLSGTTNYVVKFTAAATGGNSQIFDNGTNVGIGTSSPSQQLQITGNFRLPATTTTTGVIYSGATRYIHNYGSYNFFAGEDAGNFTMTGSNNTGTGVGALYDNTTGYFNTATGRSALYNNKGGYFNTANGASTLYYNNEGNNNTASGAGALYFNTSASRNIAIGYNALRTQSYAYTGTAWNSDNVAIGNEALYSNQPTSHTTGIQNTAVGNFALRSNTTGYYNTANGFNALYSNTTGYYNTANGFNALYSNTEGDANTANGKDALYSNTTGGYNTAIGHNTLFSNKTGSSNTANGRSALSYNTTGYHNTAIGSSALLYTSTGVQNTSVGANSLTTNTTGSFNTAIGYNTGPSSTNYGNTTCVGIDATATGSNMVRIGNVFVTSIGGQVGWSTLSDERFKENVSEGVPGLNFITQLRPITYQINREKFNAFTGVSEKLSKIANDSETNYSPLQSNQPAETVTGFFAQEVEAVADKMGYNFSGVDKPKNENDYYGLRYAEFVVPLVKAVQELNKQNKELSERVSELEARVKSLVEQK